MRNITLYIQYDGTNYKGWQIQTNYRHLTIQGVLQEAIFKLTGHYSKVIAAGRTDAGVHAISQVVSFKTTSTLDSRTIQRALNAMLPYDIRIQDIIEKDIDFHPRYDAKSKKYSYLISNSYLASPFLARYTWNISYNLDIEAMMVSLKCLIGKHDFSSFRGSGCGAKTTLRTIYSISLENFDKIDFMTFPLEGNFLKISIEADGFLRHMVRNIVGTTVEIGRKRLLPEDMQRILYSIDRRLAGMTAPARGLYLEKIDY